MNLPDRFVLILAWERNGATLCLNIVRGCMVLRRDLCCHTLLVDC